MAPCAWPGCPALATRGACCPVHADGVLVRVLDAEEADARAAAKEAMLRIAAMYHKPGPHSAARGIA